jgi:hypothetical protein
MTVMEGSVWLSIRCEARVARAFARVYEHGLRDHLFGYFCDASVIGRLVNWAL